MPEPLLEVRNLNGYYGSAHVLQDVSLDVGSDPVAVIGRNGMGKSTLCLALLGLLDSTSGSARFQGQELVGLPPYKIAALGIGYVPQGRRLFQSLTVEEHLRLVAGRRNGAGWTAARVYELFPRLEQRRSLSAMQLSGGEQQMLAIARALLLDPKLLIMDEPSEGLAPVVVARIGAIIREIKATGAGVLLIEQNVKFAATVADRHYLLSQGRIVETLDNDEFRRREGELLKHLGI